MSVKILAHRGYSEISPENTELAFDAAKIFGFDGIEIDVHKTKDNKLVVIHDETIDRTSNGIGKIQNLTLDEIRRFDFSSKFGKNYLFQKIMTYKEFLLKYENLFEILNVEIKTDIIHYKGIEQLIWNVHQQIKPKAKIIYSSFNFKSLDILHKINKNAILGFLFVDEKDIFGKEEEIKRICKYIHPWFKSMLNSKSLESYKKIGLPINLWTFDKRNTKDEWTKGSNQAFKKISQMPNVYSLICNSKY